MARISVGLLWVAGFPLACGARAPAVEAAGSSGQSYTEALELICHVDERAGIDVDADPIGVDGARWDFIKAEVKNPDAVYFRTILEVKDTNEQAELLQSEADRKALAGCPLAESLGDG
jgi:hypothetical protein